MLRGLKHVLRKDILSTSMNKKFLFSLSNHLLTQIIIIFYYSQSIMLFIDELNLYFRKICFNSLISICFWGWSSIGWENCVYLMNKWSKYGAKTLMEKKQKKDVIL